MRFNFIYLFCFLLLNACGLVEYTNTSSLIEAADVSRPKKSRSTIPQASVKKKVDILFIVDSHPALMDMFLKKVKNSFKGFIPFLSAEANWKIAFTNADYDPESKVHYHDHLFAGSFMPLELNGEVTMDHILHSHSKNKEQIFLETLKRYEIGDKVGHSIDPCYLPPYCQSYIRNPVQSLSQAITMNPGFFRYDADAIAIIFTTGDEMSISPKPSSKKDVGAVQTVSISSSDDLTSPAESLISILKDTFYKHYGAYRKIRIFSISIIPNDENCLKQIIADRNLPGIAYSNHIYEVVKQTGGRMISICSSSYSDALISAIVHTE